ncbi:MAG: PPC domain-containing protein [Treponema sp.]|jgi:hypothetical protein|nr:PPC domain-containing protein [Treponema sp.]
MKNIRRYPVLAVILCLMAAPGALAQQNADWNEPNDRQSQATPMPLNARVEAFISPGDADWYRIMLPAQGGYLEISTGGAQDTLLSLYDAKGNELGSDDDSGENSNALLYGTLAGGIYYIEVSCYSWSSGAYSLQILALPEHPLLSLLNATGYTIYYLYVRPSEGGGWGNDLLGYDTLWTGNSFDISLNGPGYWDLMAVDEDNDSYTIYGLYIQTDSSYRLTIGDIDW